MFNMGKFVNFLNLSQSCLSTCSRCRIIVYLIVCVSEGQRTTSTWCCQAAAAGDTGESKKGIYSDLCSRLPVLRGLPAAERLYECGLLCVSPVTRRQKELGCELTSPLSLRADSHSENQSHCLEAAQRRGG